MGIVENDEKKETGAATTAQNAQTTSLPIETSHGEGKYHHQCSLCGKAPTEKHWAGQYFHIKCLRKVRKGARGML